MASKETEQLLEDELQALHQSIEQLNAGNSEGCFQNRRQENEYLKLGKRKRANQADVQTQTPKKTRKRQINIPEEIVGDLDSPIDEILEEIAQRKNLTTNNVKHLLRNIIANESVQEMLKCSLDSSLKMSFEPKLTRSKTKEWLETQKCVAWPSSAKKTSETQILMEVDFPEDSSDDEYKPNEEDTDNHSDEESFLSSHTSDIGSPASSAPATPYVLQIDDNFKKPFPIEHHQIQDDLIGSRTRSKLPLNDTPLEHLELAFIPPDISTDMYDSDCDNEEWRKFLKEFVCPPHHSVENVDDEEADPEYNVLEEEEEVDDEELRADRTVQITKKEVSELLSELFEEDFSSSDEEIVQEITSNQARISEKQPSEDILQTAISDIIVHLEPTSTGNCKALGKPTGIVQPLLFEEAPQELPITVTFPTLDCAPIEIYPQSQPFSTFLDDSVPESSTIVLSSEATLLLCEQMRKHVQLLTQTHLLTAQHSALSSVTDECRHMLQDLFPLTQKFEVANLQEAYDLVTCWETLVPRTPFEDFHKYQIPIVCNGEKKKFVKRSNKHPDRCPFNPQMVELMAESRVFIYPELLPKIAVFQVEQGPCKASPHEEQLIAMGLEQFTPYCTELLIGSKGCTETLICSMISHYMLPHWSTKRIAIRIKQKIRKRVGANPIKYYMEHKVAPPVHHNAQPFNRFSTPRLCDTPSTLLPDRWRELMLIHHGANHRFKRKSPFPLRPSVSQILSPYNSNIVAPRSSSNIPFSKPRGRKLSVPAKHTNEISKDKSSVVRSSQVEDDQATLSNQPTMDAPSDASMFQTTQLDVDPLYAAAYPISLEPNQGPNVATKETSKVSKKKKPFKEKSSDSATTDLEFDQVSITTTEKTQCEGDNACSVQASQIEINGNTPDLNKSNSKLVDLNENSLREPAVSPERLHILKSSISRDSAVVSENLDMSSNDSIRLEVTETDLESEPEPPLNTSSPHVRKSLTPLASNHGAKRYILIERPNTSDTRVMHVWGPVLDDQANIPLRKTADNHSQNSTRGKTSSQKDNRNTAGPGSSICLGNSYPSGENSSGTVGGNGGDDGDKPPSSPAPGHSLDENVVVEDEDEEEDNISLDLLTIAPSSTNLAPSKAKSPAHRQIRHQRNARRILDSWMADDDPTQPRSDAYAQIYFMKVRSRLEQQNHAAFKDFVTTLGHFQSKSSSTLDLYKKMECILKDHPDLMEEFVLFLSPETAAQCGVQFQHFLYVRMREFFSKLKIHFKDSPSQLKRTLKTLQQVESSVLPNVNDIKNAILPLLKGNAHLTQAFLQLFPDDAPQPSESGDFEDINMDQVNSGDEFEHVHLKEATAPSKENELKVGKRIGGKGNIKSKSKGKAWKKSA